MVLNRFQLAAVKRTAQNTKKLVEKREKVNAQIQKLEAELESINAQIGAWETPIKVMTGGYTSEQILSWDGVIPEDSPAVNAEEEVPNE